MVHYFYDPISRTNTTTMHIRNILFAISIIMISCKQPTHVVKTQTTVYPLNKPGFTTVDSTVLKSYASYKHIIDSTMNRVIIVSERNMDKKTPEGLLGNMAADASFEELKQRYFDKDLPEYDFCFLNNGGLRASLPAGDITVGNIFSLMPFENEMVVLVLSGATTEKLLNFIAAKGGMPVSGVTMKIRDTLATDILIKGKPFDSNRNYVVATSDYLANGGDNLDFLSEAIAKYSTGFKLRDLIILNLENKNKQGQKLSAKIEGRITYVK